MPELPQIEIERRAERIAISDIDTSDTGACLSCLYLWGLPVTGLGYEATQLYDRVIARANALRAGMHQQAVAA